MEPKTIELSGKPYFLQENEQGIFRPVIKLYSTPDGWQYHLDGTKGKLIINQNIKEIESNLELFLRCPINEKPLPKVIDKARDAAKTFWCDYVALTPYDEDYFIARLGEKDNENYLVIKPRFFLINR